MLSYKQFRNELLREVRPGCAFGLGFVWGVLWLFMAFLIGYLIGDTP
jgi:hypothetical protein